jgi:RNA polymerase sigma-70 factor, ECF subfamily
VTDRPTLPAPSAAEAPELTWVRRAQAGDEEAFEELFRAHHESVFRLVLSIVRHEQDARELCQDVWVTVWQRLGTFRHDAKFTTWLHPIAVRRAIDHLRKKRRWFDRFLPFMRAGEDSDENPAAVPEPADPDADARTLVETQERQARFERCLQGLPPAHRAVLLLREVQGLSYEEIAQHLGCRPGTVMSRLFHARRHLARKLKDLPCD